MTFELLRLPAGSARRHDERIHGDSISSREHTSCRIGFPALIAEAPGPENTKSDPCRGPKYGPRRDNSNASHFKREQRQRLALPGKDPFPFRAKRA